MTLCSNSPVSWVYLNTDGSVQLEDGSATARGVMRNQNGDWIIGFNRFLESCSIFNAELRGILDGHEILIARGFENVMIRTYSLEVVTAIQESLIGGSNSAMIRRIL